MTPAQSRLRALLAETGLTHRQFAQACGVATSTVARWATGHEIPAERESWLLAVTIRATRGRVHLVIQR